MFPLFCFGGDCGTPQTFRAKRWHLDDDFQRAHFTGVECPAFLLTGLFVSFFIGDRIILSGLTHEKKMEEKTESEVRAEGALLLDMHGKLTRLEKEIAEIKDKTHTH